MKVTFTYDQKRDIWCLLKFGKNSSNSPMPTTVYTKMISAIGETPTDKAVAEYIIRYLANAGLSIPALIEQFNNDWDAIADDFKNIAEGVFGLRLEQEIIAYLTINNRCPFNIEENWFMVTARLTSPTDIVMHELWHFYTWHRFGIEWQRKIGAAKYNDLKESLTVLLNVECQHLLPQNTLDKGYPQHQELRTKILQLWEEERNLEALWSKLAQA
jgi:hypothetical protein